LEETAPHTAETFSELLDRELSVFKQNKAYSYVQDLKDAFPGDKPEAARIFDTIPHHVFWDVKVPQIHQPKKAKNPYNPARVYPFTSFFEFRDYEEYNDRRELKHNLRDDISLYRRY
jgi:hypothetical protein